MNQCKAGMDEALVTMTLCLMEMYNQQTYNKYPKFMEQMSSKWTLMAIFVHKFALKHDDENYNAREIILLRGEEQQ